MWYWAWAPVGLAWGWLICFVAGAIAYNNGVNVLAWSQCRAMKRLGYDWLTPEPRYQQTFEAGLRSRVVRQSTKDQLWYAEYWEPISWTADDWNTWRSEVGFGNPIAAHAYAEVQGWRAQ